LWWLPSSWFGVLRCAAIGVTMAVDERSRHELFTQLERVLGVGAATTLLEHLPPSGWSDVATTRDLDQLELRMGLRFDARFEAVDARIDAAKQETIAAFRGELVSAITTQTRTMIFTMAGAVVSLAAVALSVVRLA